MDKKSPQEKTFLRSNVHPIPEVETTGKRQQCRYAEVLYQSIAKIVNKNLGLLTTSTIQGK